MTLDYYESVTAKLRTEAASSRTRVDIGALTHQGRIRPNNEDCYFVTRIERSLSTILTNLPEDAVPYQYNEVGYGFLVADGMGGSAAGEVASREVVSKLVALALDTPDWHMRLDSVGTNEVLAKFDQRFRQLRETLIEMAAENPALSGMGTTLTVALSLGPRLIIAHVGDSRTYLLHDGKLQQLTRDQTLAQDLAEIGVIKPEDVARHHSRHILTGVISTQGEEAQAELLTINLADTDQVLLCTDGLTEMVSDNEIREVLTNSASATEACSELVELALDHGGKDNVTVVVGRYQMLKPIE